jgi:hypothetical protein
MLRIGFIAAGASGLAYGYLRYFRRVAGEFGPEPHAWQAFAQHAHVLVAPTLLFALGFALRGHVLVMLRHSITRGRRTGLILLALAAPMAFGGFAIQVATGTTARTLLGWTHSALSILFIALYMLHWTKPRPRETLPKAVRTPSDAAFRR